MAEDRGTPSNAERIRLAAQEYWAHAPTEAGTYLTERQHVGGQYFTEADWQARLQVSRDFIDDLLRVSPDYNYDHWSANANAVQTLFEKMPGTVLGYEAYVPPNLYVMPWQTGGTLGAAEYYNPFSLVESLDEAARLPEKYQFSKQFYRWCYGCAGLIREDNGHWVICYIIAVDDGHASEGLPLEMQSEYGYMGRPYAIFYDITKQRFKDQWVAFPGLHESFQLSKENYEQRHDAYHQYTRATLNNLQVFGSIYRTVPMRVRKTKQGGLIFGRPFWYMTSSPPGPLYAPFVEKWGYNSQGEWVELQPGDEGNIYGKVVWQAPTYHGGIELFGANGESMGRNAVQDCFFASFIYRFHSGPLGVPGDQDAERQYHLAPSWCLGDGVAYWLCDAKPLMLQRVLESDPEHPEHATSASMYADERVPSKFPWADHIQNDWLYSANTTAGFICANSEVVAALPQIESEVEITLTTWTPIAPGDHKIHRDGYWDDTDWFGRTAGMFGHDDPDRWVWVEGERARGLRKHEEEVIGTAVFQPRGVLCYSSKLEAPVYIGRFTSQPIGPTFAGSYDAGHSYTSTGLKDLGWSPGSPSQSISPRGTSGSSALLDDPALQYLRDNLLPQGEEWSWKDVSHKPVEHWDYTEEGREYESFWFSQSGPAGAQAVIDDIDMEEYFKPGTGYMYIDHESSSAFMTLVVEVWQPVDVPHERLTADYIDPDTYYGYYHAQVKHRSPITHGDDNTLQSTWDGTAYDSDQNSNSNTALHYGFIWSLSQGDQGGGGWSLQDDFVFKTTEQIAGDRLDPVYKHAMDPTSYPVNATEGVDKCIYIHMSNHYVWRWDPTGPAGNCEVMKTRRWTGDDVPLHESQLGPGNVDLDPEVWVSEKTLEEAGISVPVNPHSGAGADTGSWQEGFGNEGPGPHNAGLPGDANQDGVVDAADYTIINDRINELDQPSETHPGENKQEQS
tara:strand:+ start:17712 stop:20582 length:2871 start_codon:yes stop_codon:yes gene_type:complete